MASRPYTVHIVHPLGEIIRFYLVAQLHVGCYCSY
jgi:hypothetical protein